MAGVIAACLRGVLATVVLGCAEPGGGAAGIAMRAQQEAVLRAEVPPAEVVPMDVVSSGVYGRGSDDRVSFDELMAASFDLSRLSELPRAAYRVYLASSRDRTSDGSVPGSAGWFANADWISLSRNEPRVLLDVAGPGVVMHIWSASPTGVIRIEIDDTTTPVVEADMKALLSGRIEPFSSPFGFSAAGGYNLFFPIPFQTRCRVTVVGDSNLFYFQIGYRSYPPQTRIEPFDAEGPQRRAEQARAALRLAAERSTGAALTRVPRAQFELNTHGPGATVAAGPTGGVLRELRVRSVRPEREALRSTILSIRFDGVETVRAPLGDFFASGARATPVDSLPVSVTSDGLMISRWPMAFQREAQISIESATAQQNQISLSVAHEDYAFGGRSLYFHAHWHAPETFPSLPPHDWTLSELHGQGMYVGNVLNVVNSAESWWGEGDEKIWVDEELFPSRFGTGTEDYYGYAWGSTQVFSSYYTGQPLAPTQSNFGSTSLYRFHVLDAIPFQRSMRFDLEVQHSGNVAAIVTYDAISFWYARPYAVALGARAP